MQYNGSATSRLTSNAFSAEEVPLNCRKVPFCNNCESFELNRDFRRNFCMVHQSSKNPAFEPDFFSPWQAVRVQRRIDKRTRQGKTAAA